MTSRMARLVLVAALVTTALAVGVVSAQAGASSPPQKTITLQGAAYTPKAPAGGTDDYHCTLVNPHVNKDSYIVSAQFYPNSIEVHHAILFLIPPALAATALADDRGGKGWTCFGESALPNSIPTQSGGQAPVTKTAAVSGGPGGKHFQDNISNTPWLTAWAPGHGAAYMPKGTGVQLPAGSLVVMQIHYNLLRGDKPVRAKLQLHTVPASTPLQSLHLDLLVAPPDVPCAAAVTGPLCSRSAELTSIGQRFGARAFIVMGLVAAAATAQADPTKIRMGWVATPASLVPLLFAHDGVAKHNGISYTVEAIHFQGSPLQITAIQSGDLDVAALGFSSFGLAVENAGIADLKIIADETQWGVPGYGDALFAVLKVGLTGHLRCDDCLGGGPVLLMGDVDGRKATEFCLGIAGHSLKGRVRRDIAPVQADHVDTDGDAFEQVAPAFLAHRQFAIEAGIFQRDRSLRRQQLQDRDPGGSENGDSHVVLDVEHADQLGLFDQRQTEDRSDAPGSDVFVC